MGLESRRCDIVPPTAEWDGWKEMAVEGWGLSTVTSGFRDRGGIRSNSVE